MSQLARRRFTFAEYLRLEDERGVRHELFEGVAYAMARESPNHAAVCANVIGLLRNALEGRRCRVHTTDLRIRVVATGLTTYPDASVVCERLELDPKDADGNTAVNPTLWSRS